MKIFTTDGIKHIVDKTIDRDELSMLTLMERAAAAVTYELVSL